MNHQTLPDTAHGTQARTGVLLVNLGTPDAPTAPAIRRYLRQFLSDPRVVELPRALWLPILHGVILPFRPARLAHAYAKVWTRDGSPLLAIAREQQAALQASLGDRVQVGLAMTYGDPSIPAAMDAFAAAGVRRVLVLPLYPQYSGTTTAAAFDGVFQHLGRQRWWPELRLVNSYHDDPAYIEALAESVERHWSGKGRGDHLVISFHSIPRRYLDQGDPYYCHCQKTARLLVDRLKLAAGSWSVTFQSRLGRQPWLQPYTDIAIPQLARRGVKTMDVVCPGFAADCLETLEEVALRYAADFVAAGGADLRYIPALNAGPRHVDALAALCRTHMQGWPMAQRVPGAADEIRRRLERVDLLKPTLHSECLL